MKIINIVLFLIVGSNLSAQNYTPDNFTIGMYTYQRSVDKFTSAHNDPHTADRWYILHKYSKPLPADQLLDSIDVGTHKIASSVFNIFREDGINMVLIYDGPDTLSARQQLTIAMNNNIRIIFDYKGEFLPTNTGTSKIWSGAVEGGFITNPPKGSYRPNLWNTYSKVLSNPKYNRGLWGLQIGEEPSANHAFSTLINGRYCDQNPNNIESGCVFCSCPPKAISDFSDTLNKWNLHSGVEVIAAVSEADHGGPIDPYQTFLDTFWNPNHGPYRPFHYIIPDSMPTRPSAFINSSYTISLDQIHDSKRHSRFLLFDTSRTFQRKHYLSRYMTIDFAKQYYKLEIEGLNIDEWGYGSVFFRNPGISDTSNPAVYNNIVGYLGDKNHVAGAWFLHSDLTHNDKEDKRNGNALWFQAYTSIIHGTNGIIFWKFPNWNPTVTDSVHNDSLGIYIQGQMEHPYKREYFPESYNAFVAPLCRELNWLSNQGFIGRISTTIYVKKGHSDDNCIVPKPEVYMRNIPGITDERIDEFYGLRYTINQNPKGEVVMIISNPLPDYVEEVELDLSNLGNPAIANADSIEFLFTDETDIHGAYYKVGRSKTEYSTGNPSKNRKVAFENHKIKLAFSPLDVQVIRFITKTVTSIDDIWEEIWTNNATGELGGATLHSTDTILTGDFLGRGTEQILLVQGRKDDAWISMHSFNESRSDWDWIWSNNGDKNHPLRKFNKNIVIGDFNGNGKDEIFGYDPVTGFKTDFEYNEGISDWIKIWESAPDDHFNLYRENFIPGDFIGSQSDQLIAFNKSGWITEFALKNADFQWDLWSDYGSGVFQKLKSGKIISADFNEDGRDDLLFISDTTAAIFSFETGNWIKIWSAVHREIGGWQLPLRSTDQLLYGDLNGDKTDDLFFIQSGGDAAWATAMQLKSVSGDLIWDWIWNARPDGNIHSISSWNLNQKNAHKTNYALLKVNKYKPDYLLCSRIFGCYSWSENPLISLYKNNSRSNGGISSVQNQSVPETFVVKCFPNPVNQILKIETAENTAIKEVELCDLAGKTLLSSSMINENKFFLNVSGLIPGTYLIKITVNDIVVNRLIVKE
ncbi:MAG: T9SS type A sorting domain-containing protein [Bacteroidetes bacterium]|nr:T9SS type A sorting domain-containing protein [Bacteroidota bacterium]